MGLGMAWPSNPMMIRGATEGGYYPPVVGTMNEQHDNSSLDLFLSSSDLVRVPTDDYIMGLVLQELL